MAKHRRTNGTGITAREVEIYSGDDMPPAFDAFAQRWNAKLAEGGGQFAAVVLDIKRACRRIADEVGPFQPDSVEHFARRIVRAIEATRNHIALGDADSAARAAIEVGALCAEARLKGLWEAPALRAEKADKAFNAVANSKNRERKEAAARRYAEWQATAENLWTKNPHLSASDAAEIISKRTGIPTSTIRHQIVRKVK